MGASFQWINTLIFVYHLQLQKHLPYTEELICRMDTMARSCTLI